MRYRHYRDETADASSSPKPRRVYFRPPLMRPFKLLVDENIGSADLIEALHLSGVLFETVVDTPALGSGCKDEKIMDYGRQTAS
jgi:hypothetical protein